MQTNLPSFSQAPLYLPAHYMDMNLRKRRLSESSDSDHYADQLISSPETASPNSRDSEGSGSYRVAKKKRRGLIEKRRRDRINNSLNELKSLIPTACERQVSTKLEKSEVLHLAVEHIRALQMKDQMVAIDYQSLGYQQCMSEVGQFLVNMMGLAATDPLHTRLISHLQKQVTTLEKQASAMIYEQCPINYPNNYNPVCKVEPPSPNSVYSQPTYDDCLIYNKQPLLDVAQEQHPIRQNEMYMSTQNCQSWPASIPPSANGVAYQSWA